MPHADVDGADRAKTYSNKSKAPEVSRKPSKAREVRFEQILESAAKVFAANGYSEATIQQIAAELHMTGAALYYYVKSKDELLYLIWQRAGARLQAMIDEIRETDHASELKVRLVFRRHLRVIHEDRAIFEVLIQHRSRLPEYGREQLVDDERKYVHTFAALLQELPTAALARQHPRMSAIAMISTLNSVLRWRSHENGPALDDVADFYFALFFKGVAGQLPPPLPESAS